MNKLKVEKILNGKLFELCYFIHEENSKVGVCVDPGYETNTIMSFIKENNYEVSDILLTHGHFDHMLSTVDLIKEFNSKVYMSKDDEEMLLNAEHNYSNLINKTSFEKIDIHKFVGDDEIINLIGKDIKCIKTPGHTKGGMCFYFEKDKIVFTGDTLFYETFGRVDLYGGSYKELKNSIINKLFLLPNEVFVYPGHGENTTIGHEKNNNEIRGVRYEF